MGTETKAGFADLSPSVQAAIIANGLQLGRDADSTHIEVDSLGNIYILGIFSGFGVEYPEKGVNLEDGAYDMGSVPVVRRRL